MKAGDQAHAFTFIFGPRSLTRWVQPDPYHCRLYASCAELLGDEGVDAVFILTNAETHARYAIAAMETGDWG